MNPQDTCPDPPTAAADPARERILRVAADLFSARGYARTTTRAIAAAAGVNEVTLFRRFGSKLNLLVAVVDRFSALPDLSALVADGFSGDYRSDMLRLGHAFQAIMAQRRAAIRLLLCEAQQVPELRQVVGGMPHQLRRILAAYLRDQVAAGRVRPLDPEVMAQAFFGLFFAYNLSETLVPEPLAGGMDVDAVVEQFVDLFVAGTIAEG